VGQQAENDEINFGLNKYKAEEARLCFKGINYWGEACSMQRQACCMQMQ